MRCQSAGVVIRQSATTSLAAKTSQTSALNSELVFSIIYIMRITDQENNGLADA
jgi:hypothetical protein